MNMRSTRTAQKTSAVSNSDRPRRAVKTVAAKRVTTSSKSAMGWQVPYIPPTANVAGAQIASLVERVTPGTRTRKLPAVLRSPASKAIQAQLPAATPATSRVFVDLWQRVRNSFKTLHAPKKRLHVCESVSLGEKRFLAIVRVDSESFLLGGATGNVAMLAKLNDAATFSSVLEQKSCVAGLVQ